jgi:hypothetical protein
MVALPFFQEGLLVLSHDAPSFQGHFIFYLSIDPIDFGWLGVVSDRDFEQPFVFAAVFALSVDVNMGWVMVVWENVKRQSSCRVVINSAHAYSSDQTRTLV